MKKIIVLGLFVALLWAGSASAQTTGANSVAEIQKLMEQIARLQAELESLKKQQAAIQTEMRQAIALTKELRLGLSGDDVKTLQEILATDPDIYPEGLVTGYFGPKTEKAVKKFQEKFGITQVGKVGPQTLEKINTILSEGAGNSGKVPPGLLVAPGIAKKIGYKPTPPAGQPLPPGIMKKIEVPTTTPDVISPMIREIVASSTASTTALIKWTTDEKTTGKLWYGTTTPTNTSAPAMLDSIYRTVHSFSLSGLTASTTYYYVVSASDMSGNTSTSTEKSFSTPQ